MLGCDCGRTDWPTIHVLLSMTVDLANYFEFKGAGSNSKTLELKENSLKFSQGMCFSQSLEDAISSNAFWETSLPSLKTRIRLGV